MMHCAIGDRAGSIPWRDACGTAWQADVAIRLHQLAFSDNRAGSPVHPPLPESRASCCLHGDVGTSEAGR